MEGRAGTPRAHRVAELVESLDGLEAPASRLARAIRGAIPAGPVKDALSGSWLGHPLHPLLTDVAIGAWLSAAALDLWGGRETEAGADRLVALGCAAAVPTAVTGASDWADTNGGARRVGLVHAASNGAGLALYAASLAARASGSRRRGVALSLAGAAAIGAGAFLGGHLSYARGIGVNQTAFEEPPHEWTAVLDADRLPEGRPVRAQAGETPVLLVRRGVEVLAISNNCSHRGGSLCDGELDGDVVTCPLHGSRFRLSDGSVVRGPASAPQPAFEARLRDGRVEVRPRTLERALAS